MDKQLLLADDHYVKLTVTPEALESSTIQQQWLYHFEYINNSILDHDTYRAMIISAKSYDEAELVFHGLLVNGSYEYDGSTWSADVIGIDLKLDRAESVVCSDFLHA